ncbi:MAG: type VI secretion system baseplate subunit TssG [Desulfuromonas sp.]
MLSAARGKYPALIQDLVENAPGYEFYQALQLVEADASDSQPGAAGLCGRMRLRPAPEISFPAADIRRCALDESGRLDFELNFSGLYGVDSPLPHFFLDTVAAGEDSGEVVRSFLDLFCQRLYQLHYLAWKKFHCHASRGERSLYARYLEALSGLDTPGTTRRLAYAGLIGSRVKNQQGLTGMLEDYLQMPVAIRQYAPCWVFLDSVPSLGGAEELVLGKNALLGNRVLDLSRNILIQVGPVALEQARSLLPGQPGAKELGHLIRQYLDPTMQFDIDLKVRPKCGATTRLGSQEVILGWTSWLGDIGREGNVIHLPGNCFGGDE